MSAGVALRRCLRQRLALPEVDGVKALGAPAIERCRQLTGFRTLALVLPQPGEAGAARSSQELWHHRTPQFTLTN
jgi:hypothetical protein